MQPFDFVTRYCCFLVFCPLVVLMLAALAAGSVGWAALFGVDALLVRAVEEDIVRWMAGS